MKRNYIIFVVFLIFMSVPLWVFMKYGGGREYEDISTEPLYQNDSVETVFSYDEPIGNVAVSKDIPPRVFFTVHPESRPEGSVLLEIRDEEAVPFPNRDFQDNFHSILGVYVDNQGCLWVLDHGNHGLEDVALFAFRISDGEKVYEYTFSRDIAPIGSFFNDLSVSPDGRYVVIADVNFFGKNPSVVLHDTNTQESSRFFEGDESVRDEGFVPVTPQKKMRFFGGAIDLLTGIDGIDFSPDGKYVYFASMGHSQLYRFPFDSITTKNNLSSQERKQVLERVVTKPLSDGIRLDDQGNVYITDIEHQGVFVVRPNGESETLFSHPNIRWADGLSLGSDGYMYLADSAIPDQMLRSKKHIQESAPYYIYRFPVLEGGDQKEE